MAPRTNPLKLNNLQLKTLTLLQELARHPESSTPVEDSGDVMITYLPQPHGDHFHIGDAVSMARDATGLHNESVWKALERKGLAKSSFPIAIAITPEGLAYDTGLQDRILHRHEH